MGGDRVGPAFPRVLQPGTSGLYSIWSLKRPLHNGLQNRGHLARRPCPSRSSYRWLSKLGCGSPPSKPRQPRAVNLDRGGTAQQLPVAISAGPSPAWFQFQLECRKGRDGPLVQALHDRGGRLLPKLGQTVVAHPDISRRVTVQADIQGSALPATTPNNGRFATAAMQLHRRPGFHEREPLSYKSSAFSSFPAHGT